MEIKGEGALRLLKPNAWYIVNLEDISSKIIFPGTGKLEGLYPKLFIVIYWELAHIWMS